MIELEAQRTATGTITIRDAVANLAAALKTHPAYAALLAAHQRLQSDTATQELLRDLQTRQRQLQMGVAGTSEEEFQERLEAFYSRPVVAAYHEAEETLVDLLKEVDGVISEAAGINFAANARRSCCGG
jgi:cell fate (sporulation/competence/biofilm development) regulator YlbF (YheA/YmcA/DUF963 family)